MPHPRTWALGLAGLFLAACDSAPASLPAPPPAPPAPPAPPPPVEPGPAEPPPPAGPGQLDPELVRAAASAEGVEKVHLKAEPDGSIRYFAVYHQDADAIPEPVRKQLDVVYPGARALRYESEFVVPHGRLHEIEVETADKQECELSAQADGAIVYTECHIDPRALPEPVRAAFDRAHPGAAIKQVEKKSVPGAGDEYEVQFEVGGRLHQLLFRPDGAVLRHELRIPAVLTVPVL
jgi:hypothetical protein